MLAIAPGVHFVSPGQQITETKAPIQTGPSTTSSAPPATTTPAPVPETVPWYKKWQTYAIAGGIVALGATTFFLVRE